MGILNNKIIKIIIRIIEYIFIVMLFIYACFLVLCKITENNYIKNYKFMIIDNNSLMGKYNKYDPIIVKRKDYNQYRVGDIVAYKETKTKDNYQVIRMIYNIENSNDLFVTTRGLNNKLDNPEINTKDIYGEILDNVPVVTEICQILHSKNKVFYVYIPIFLLILLELFYAFSENARLKNTDVKIVPMTEKDKKKRDKNKTT